MSGTFSAGESATSGREEGERDKDLDGFLRSRRVAILGLGLMGGSLALALRGRVAGLFAADPDPATRTLAMEKKVVDRIAADPTEILGQANTIILAAPVGAILEHIRLLGDRASHMPEKGAQSGPDLGSCKLILLDLGSTKQDIVAAMQALPPAYDPLGGHPMCGKETSGLVNAEAGLYRGATFAFTPLERTGSAARRFAQALASALGAAPLWIDPVTHDRWVAATSHLPYLVANILAGSTPFETAPLVGPGFRSTSRLASSSLPVMLDIMRTNRQHVLRALQRFRGRLEEVEVALGDGDYTALSALLAEAAERHQTLVHNHGDRKS